MMTSQQIFYNTIKVLYRLERYLCYGMVPDPMFFDLLDPYPDPLVRGTDLASDPDLLSSHKKNKKYLDSYCFFYNTVKVFCKMERYVTVRYRIRQPEIRIWLLIRIFLSSNKNSKKNLDSYRFVTFFVTFYFRKMMYMYLQKVPGLGVCLEGPRRK